MHIEKDYFGTTLDGDEVFKYTITNNNGFLLSILNFGGVIQKFIVPDKNGIRRDIVLGFDTIQPYELPDVYMGGILGRYANRLTKGQYDLGNKTISLSQNEGANHFHGGFRGYHKRMWKATPISLDNQHGIELSYVSKDGEEGYCGELMTTVMITLSDFNEVKINFKAHASNTTPINLSYSAFFNFLDSGASSILRHCIRHFANKYTLQSIEKTATGEIADLPNRLKIFQHTNRIEDYLRFQEGKNGIDENLVIEKFQKISQMAVLCEEESGIEMEIRGTQPCLQIYSGQDIDHSILGKNQTRYLPFSGICLEPQHYPDSLNHPKFPSSILSPTGTYSEKICYSFTIKK